MLAGVVISAIVTGAAAAAAAVALGHPPMLWLVTYSLSGFCGTCAFLLAALGLRRGEG